MAAVAKHGFSSEVTLRSLVNKRHIRTSDCKELPVRKILEKAYLCARLCSCKRGREVSFVADSASQRAMNLCFAARVTHVERSDLSVQCGATLQRTKKVDASCLDRHSLSFRFLVAKGTPSICSPSSRMKALLFRSENSTRKGR